MRVLNSRRQNNSPSQLPIMKDQRCNFVNLNFSFAGVLQTLRDQVQGPEAAGRGADQHCPAFQRGGGVHRRSARRWRSDFFQIHLGQNAFDCVATQSGWLCSTGGYIGVRSSALTNDDQYSARWTTCRDSNMFPTGCRPWSSGIK